MIYFLYQILPSDLPVALMKFTSMGTANTVCSRRLRRNTKIYSANNRIKWQNDLMIDTVTARIKSETG